MVQTDSANFDTVLLPFAQVETAISAELSLLRSYRDISPDAGVRKASSTAAAIFGDFVIKASISNDGPFKLVDAVPRNGEHLDI
jgi:metallopeptidase MepB